ncbi:TetR/AcrR family transcriptional regulator [Nonomuraea turkmeniaca]|uniref:TetR/AcrR family transcriptional regulator n=1 Tax=Nonomuraea turkmeniaca TaxID=103838 RepID=A0A5S4EYG5_9ACTN|nr:TetR/AcrR family transcriptional regulator [Nonomuraea turkmeniaca]TMR08733.1 TetR/AcrR family transcriptional regulator [Nonomuraea turkmeniaca]
MVAAAHETISEQGLSALSIRRIAAKIGMSPGSVLYHYPDVDDLLYDLHRTLVDRYVTRRAHITAAIPEPPRRIVHGFKSGLPSGPDDKVCKALYELHDLGARHDRHAALMTSLWDREKLLFESIVVAGAASGDFHPSRPPDELAASFLAMEDGLGLHIVSRNASLSVPMALDLLISFASAELGCDL